MDTKDEKIVNEILNEINEIICDDNLSDTEALEEILNVLIKNNITIESVIDEQKKN